MESIGGAEWGAPARSEIEMDLRKSKRYKRLSAAEQLQSNRLSEQVSNSAKGWSGCLQMYKSMFATEPKCLNLSNCLCG